MKKKKKSVKKAVKAVVKAVVKRAHRKGKPVGRPKKEVEDPEVLFLRYQFAKNLRYLREKRDLSQGELANVMGHLGWHRTTINRMEQNHHQPFVAQAGQLARFFHVSLDDMVFTNMDRETI